METDHNDVVVRSLRALRGPNVYAYMPVLHAVLDIGPYEDRPSNAFPGFVERITTWLPGLKEHECSVGRLLGAVARNPTNLGLGIDEDTAVVVGAHGTFRVIGSGAVTCVDGTHLSYSSLEERRASGIVSVYDVRLHILGADHTFDLHERRPIVPRPEQRAA